MKTDAGEIYRKFAEGGRKKLFALLDPDKQDTSGLSRFCEVAAQSEVDGVLVGGSLMAKNNFEETVKFLKQELRVPVVIFPGSVMQVSTAADAILFLSLISGRNPELLIGSHVTAAPLIHEAGLECLATGYMLIDGGQASAVSYMSHTLPIPGSKTEIAVATALAGYYLGMKMIYLDAGSGAIQPVMPAMIEAVKKSVPLPLIVGGGIRTEGEAVSACKAGADIVVVGNILEKHPELIVSLSRAVHFL